MAFFVCRDVSVVLMCFDPEGNTMSESVLKTDENEE